MDEMNYITCAFINSDTPPVKESEYTHFRVTQNYDKELTLSGMRTYYYPHPDAPEDAYITVEIDEVIINNVKISDTEYAALYLLLQAQNNIKNLCKEE